MRFCQNSARLLPIGVTAPRPVTTTRLRMGAGVLVALKRDQLTADRERNLRRAGCLVSRARLAPGQYDISLFRFTDRGAVSR